MMTTTFASKRQLLLCADAVLPMTAGNPIVQDGAVLVMGETIEAVGPRSTLLERAPDAEVRDYGRAVLMPGLVAGSTYGWVWNTNTMLQKLRAVGRWICAITTAPDFIPTRTKARAKSPRPCAGMV